MSRSAVHELVFFPLPVNDSRSRDVLGAIKTFSADDGDLKIQPPLILGDAMKWDVALDEAGEAK